VPTYGELLISGGASDTRLLIGRTDGGRRVTLVVRHLGDGNVADLHRMGHEGGRSGLMTMHNDNDRSDLTPEERDIAGSPGDLVTEQVVPPRRRSSTVMLSLRLERAVFDELNGIARRDGRTFSEIAREALRTYVVGHSQSATYPQRDHAASRAPAVRKVSESVQRTWTDDELRSALDRYEAGCRGAGMREKAWRSYVDYARRFLAWRTGDYAPRGVRLADRPVPRAAASIAELHRQATQYANVVQAAGRAQSTIDTYYGHAMFFVRWLDGDFEPGHRLRGLR
jgi:hypothetical protein